IRALEISNKEVGVSRLHFSTKEGPRIAQDLFQNGLPRLQELPKNLKNIIPPPLSQEDESPSLLQWTLWGIVGKSPLEQGKPAVEFTPHAYRDFYLATTETPFAGDGYPSWTLLGKIFWDTHFYLSVTRLHFMAVMWSVDTDETVRDLKPGFEGHPFQNILRAYDKSLSNTETRQLLESVSLGDTVPPMFLFLNRWAKGKTEQFADQSYKAAWDSLFKGAHLDLLRASAMARYLNDENERTIARLILNHLSAYHPPSLANLLFDDPASDTYREQAETLLPGNPLVAGFIGARLRKDGKLEEAIPYLETAAHELGKRWYFTKLAEIYLDQGDEERWLQTKLAYTEQVDTGLGKARNYQEIAFHYMKTGRAELALPYSLRSANSYSAWGLKTATINHLILGNREQALSYMNAEMDRYGSTLNRRIRYWMLGKLGDVETLRRELQAIPPGSNFRVGSNRYLLGFHEEAVRELIQAYERKSDNYNLLLASLILMQDGKHEEAQQLWKRIRDEYEGNSVKNYSRRANKQLAELFLEADQSSLTGEEVLTRAEEIRSSSMRQSVEYNYDFKYFTGLFLIAGGHPELAETHLKEAMHLDADRISLLFICAALRSLNVEPLDMFRTPAPIH
ncbi:MAG: hypothetical protein PF795_12440, partial [Kiritimatiellae bacterium]|nr:hypothetical protein [Kiritimatiellia bacterium]